MKYVINMEMHILQLLLVLYGTVQYRYGTYEDYYACNKDYYIFYIPAVTGRC